MSAAVMPLRVAVVTWNRRRIGGVETYLDHVIPELSAAGHQLSLWHEFDRPPGREPIRLPAGVPAWCAGELGADAAIAALRDWRPDVLYAHSLTDPELEARVLDVAPAVFFAHAYFGTCVSGSKTLRGVRAPEPCTRRFGPGCLAHYYPHRCGGLNPLVMLREYRRTRDRFDLLRRYRAIVVLSDHMRAEYLRHGFAPSRVHTLSYFPDGGAAGSLDEGEAPEVATVPVLADGEPWRLAYVGRLEYLKGGSLLLDALPLLQRADARPVELTFLGDGPLRAEWEERAASIAAAHPWVTIHFRGWVDSGEVSRTLAATHLLVVPSVWPEPFGLVGIEAGRHRVPVVANAVGGIPEWLVDGVNGLLAPGDPPTAAGLAGAISRFLSTPGTHARLRRGAELVAGRYRASAHLGRLLPVLAAAAVQK